MSSLNSPHDGMIAFVYRHILRRDATPTEVADWTGEVERGLTFDALVDLVSTSDEALGVSEAALDASIAAVGNLFSIALGRAPTSTDVAAWGEQLMQGRAVASFIDEILDSPEARSRYGRPELEIEYDAISFVYRHVLGREPSDNDLNLWSKHLYEGLSFPAFLLEVQNSEEGRRRGAALVAQDSADTIAFVYWHALGRAPTETEMGECCRHLREGLPFQDVLGMILNSEESRQRSAVEQETPSADAIASVYRHALLREPSKADLKAWMSHLSAGLPVQRLLLDVMASERAAQLEPTAEARHENFIIFVYQHALGRTPTEAELREWSGHLQTGMSFPHFLALVGGSDEARAHTRRNSRKIFAEAIAFTYRHTVGREPSENDIEVWAEHLQNGLPFQRFVLDMISGEEAKLRAASERSVNTMPDGLFIAHLYEICFGRCALPGEIEDWQLKFVENGYRKSDVAMSFIAAAIRDSDEEREADAKHDSGSVEIMGTGRILNRELWRSRTAEIKGGVNLISPEPLSAPYVVRAHTIRVSAIASLYKGGQYIRKFLDNITQQSLKENFELIIVDANSPDGERDVIEEYRKQFSNIRYERINYRIGIYDAWNVGVELARGDYLTNTNLDDLRRQDSLELQAAALDTVSFADVVYQDFFYALDADLNFEQVEAYGFKSALPLVTPNNLLIYNSPHNAPMWRKRLHSELGMFDTSMKSAGDHEFWLRCLQAGKVFYKINTPHVVYYQNPDGLSTRPGSSGLVEGRRIQRRYGRKLISPDLYLDRKSLRAKFESVSGAMPDAIDGGSTYERIQRLILSLADGPEPRHRLDLAT